MQALEPVIIVAGALAVSSITAGITAAYYRRKMRGLYNRAWLSGRKFTASRETASQ